MPIVYAYPEFRFKTVTFSFDDGVCQDEKLIAIFNRFGLKGTFNINSGLDGRVNHLPHTPETVKNIYAGHEIACHGEFHPTFDQIARTEVVREVWNDRLKFEKLTGQIVSGLAYPNGSVSPVVADTLRTIGIEYGRTTINCHPRFRYMPQDFLFWNPTCHYRDALQFAPEFLKESRPLPLLFFIWGHSYELDDNNGWQEMEKIGALLGGHSDIWYATNIEICRYIKALRALQFAADGKSVYNPSALTVYLQEGWDASKRFIVAPGETVKLV